MGFVAKEITLWALITKTNAEETRTCPTRSCVLRTLKTCVKMNLCFRIGQSLPSFTILSHRLVQNVVWQGMVTLQLAYETRTLACEQVVFLASAAFLANVSHKRSALISPLCIE